jgi:tRNA A37 threonylcarbamoyladenosine dehydratase
MTDLNRRFSSLNRLYGDDTRTKLERAHVCVVGVGGVGSWAVEALARSGVGKLTLIDADHVAESNINRQVQALTDTLGMSKINALAARIAQINPECELILVDDFVDKDHLNLLPHDAIILDCADQIQAKFAMILDCRRRKQPLLTCGAAGGKTDPTRIQFADLAHTVQDPILAKIRQQLRDKFKRSPAERAAAMKASTNQHAPKLYIQTLYSDEHVRFPNATPDNTGAPQGLNCAGFGSSVMVTASFGMAAAQWAIEWALKDAS